MTATISYHVLRAALVRDGAWLVHIDGTLGTFHHRACFFAQRHQEH